MSFPSFALVWFICSCLYFPSQRPPSDVCWSLVVLYRIKKRGLGALVHDGGLVSWQTTPVGPHKPFGHHLGSGCSTCICRLFLSDWQDSPEGKKVRVWLAGFEGPSGGRALGHATPVFKITFISLILIYYCGSPLLPSALCKDPGFCAPRRVNCQTSGGGDLGLFLLSFSLLYFQHGSSPPLPWEIARCYCLHLLRILVTNEVCFDLILI